MLNEDLQARFSQPYGEIVIGIVGAVGTNLGSVCDAIQARFKRHFDYSVKTIRVSQLLEECIEDGRFKSTISIDGSSEYRRISSSMDAGNEARIKASDGAALAYLVVSEIMASHLDEERKPRPLSRTCFLVRSLKHPAEATLLRNVYGRGFFLLGVHSPEDQRSDYLTEDLLMSSNNARDIMLRDQSESHELGQQTRDTFEQCDAFLSLHREEWSADLNRLIDLIFGHPYHTPTPDEHAMFLAYASSLRSCDLSRQVGAVIINSHGDIIATGANEVPQYGGGLYWSTSKEPHRDKERKVDPNHERKIKMGERIIQAVQKKATSGQPSLTLDDLVPTGIFDITEFGRVIHAEMEALISCARTGNTPRGGKLFCSTFPCHNCAKHIVASGIEEVVYIEPYPKSQAVDLYPDEIDNRSILAPKDKVWFRPFFGVGPRRYFDLFSMNLSQGYPVLRKDDDGKILEWNPKTRRIRFPVSVVNCFQREYSAAQRVESFLERKSDE